MVDPSTSRTKSPLKVKPQNTFRGSNYFFLSGFLRGKPDGVHYTNNQNPRIEKTQPRSESTTKTREHGLPSLKWITVGIQVSENVIGFAGTTNAHYYTTSSVMLYNVKRRLHHIRCAHKFHNILLRNLSFPDASRIPFSSLFCIITEIDSSDLQNPR